MKKILSILIGLTAVFFFAKISFVGAKAIPHINNPFDALGKNLIQKKSDKVIHLASASGLTVIPGASGLGAEASGSVTTITPDIKANGQDGPITISTSDNLSVTVSLNAGGNTNNADWWALAETPAGTWYYYNLSNQTFQPGSNVTYTGPLFDLAGYQVLSMSGLPQGTYTLYFSVDLTPDGVQTTTSGQWSSDSVVVNVSGSVTPGPNPATDFTGVYTGPVTLNCAMLTNSCTANLTIAQTGSNITGTYSDSCGATGSFSGAVNTSAGSFSSTHSLSITPCTLTGSSSATLNGGVMTFTHNSTGNCAGITDTCTGSATLTKTQ